MQHTHRPATVRRPPTPRRCAVANAGCSATAGHPATPRPLAAAGRSATSGRRDAPGRLATGGHPTTRGRLVAPGRSANGGHPAALGPLAAAGRIVAVVGFIVFWLLVAGCSYRPGDDGEVVIVSYNVQNLFDGEHDGNEYPEFDPSTSDWSTQRFQARLKRIASVLREIVPGGPDIICLQEVENENSVRELVNGHLRGMGYRHIVVVPVPGSAINVAVLSRLSVTDVRAHRVSASHTVRYITEVRVAAGENEPSLLCCHWKSKYGGAESSEEVRIAAAAVVVDRIRAIEAEDPGRPIIVMGDLNESHDEFERIGGVYPTALVPLDSVLELSASDVRAVTDIARSHIVVASSPEDLSGDADHPPNSVVMYTPWDESSAHGSYVYQGVWETIDHFLLNEALFDGAGLEYAGFAVYDESDLLDGDGYPARWNPENNWGYSDHLPIILRLSTLPRRSEPALSLPPSPDSRLGLPGSGEECEPLAAAR